VKRSLLLVLVSLVLAGCGGDDSTDATSTDTITLPASSPGMVYWLRDGKVWPVARELPATDAATAALEELFAGPTETESDELDATTAIPGGSPSVTVENGVATLASPEGSYSTAALAQIVYTLTQFPATESVEIDGQSYTRADFEEETPSVLVESPLPFEAVTSPIHATGTANTFEATFEYEVKDSTGKVVDRHFVTATSGTGTRGTFDFTTKAVDDPATLVVFESSAEDGSRIHEVEIPLSSS
jgi:germination protein M